MLVKTHLSRKSTKSQHFSKVQYRSPSRGSSAFLSISETKLTRDNKICQLHQRVHLAYVKFLEVHVLTVAKGLQRHRQGNSKLLPQVVGLHLPKLDMTSLGFSSESYHASLFTRELNRRCQKIHFLSLKTSGTQLPGDCTALPIPSSPKIRGSFLRSRSGPNEI